MKVPMASPWSVRNRRRHSSAQSGSSVQLTQVVIIVGWSSLRSLRMPELSPRSLTTVPEQSFNRALLMAVKGAPPPQSWYISGVQIVPSRSNAIRRGIRPLGVGADDNDIDDVKLDNRETTLSLRSHIKGLNVTFCLEVQCINTIV
jgi:hypothetical protein